jgi:hypothetical protein
MDRIEYCQVIWWDRGRAGARPARKRAVRRAVFGAIFFALRAHCGRDARGPGKSLELVYKATHNDSSFCDLVNLQLFIEYQIR